MQPSTIRLFTATAMLSQFGAAAMAQCGFLERAPVFSPQVGGSALATADFNGDGKLDLAIANPWSSLASVCIGNGDGTFQSPQSFNAWAGHGIACGDFNEDGLIDLAVSNESNSHVSLLLATSQATFASPRTFQAGGGSGIVSRDINGDGHLDLITCNRWNTAAIHYGDGQGNFGSPVFVTTWGGSSIVVDDFNGDGHADIVVGFASSADGVIRLGDGTGNFGPIRQMLLRNGDALAAGDFDADGYRDLVRGQQGTGRIWIVRGLGDGTFGPPIEFQTHPSWSLATGDFNSDGFLDVVNGIGSEGRCTLLQSRGLLPRIDSQPASSTTTPGGAALLAVSASRAASYQWLKDGNVIADGGPYAGTTTPQLLISSFGTVNQGAYSCRVTNSCGSIDSQPATVSCVPTLQATPFSSSVVGGETLTLSVVVPAGSQASLRWKRNGVPLFNNLHFGGVLTSTLTIRTNDPSQSGQYSIIATNVCGSSEVQVATIDVLCPADFTRDGGVDGADIDAFFAAWENGSDQSDLNRDGGIDFADVEAFFERWENGC